MGEKMGVSEVVRGYKSRSGVGLREFADQLSKGMPEKMTVSHMSVSYWINQQTMPSTDYLIHLLMHTRDWRFDFALECLAAMRPEVWGRPDGGMWALMKRLGCK